MYQGLLTFTSLWSLKPQSSAMNPPEAQQLPLATSKNPIFPSPISSYNPKNTPSDAVTVHSTVFDKWTVSVTKGPILSSQCTCQRDAPHPLSHAQSTVKDANCKPPEPSNCAFCRHDSLLTLKYRPDMVYAQNRLVISSFDGSFGIDFNGIDAVNSIGEEPCGNLQVASAAVWQGAREEALKTYESHAVSYDWTFTPDYKGTTFGQAFTVEPSCETLDMNLLTRRDPVLFFEEVPLYGDELDDNGCSEMDLKIRVVESYLFVLMRFYLRVDHVAVKLQDVRLMFQKGQNYMLRETTLRESKTCDLPKHVSPMDPVQLWTALAPTRTTVEKLALTSSANK